jgi:antirestriction protein ArdC
MAQNMAAPIWMTFRQAPDLDTDIPTGEKGSLLVYANDRRLVATDGYFKSRRSFSRGQKPS